MRIITANVRWVGNDDVACIDDRRIPVPDAQIDVQPEPVDVAPRDGDGVADMSVAVTEQSSRSLDGKRDGAGAGAQVQHPRVLDESR